MLTQILLFSSEEDLSHSDSVSEESPTAESNNVVYSSHKDIYRDIHVEKRLMKAKFPVYLVQSRITKKKYAMKVFAYKDGQPNLYFRNESRFACLRHDNVIRNLYFEAYQKTRLDNKEVLISYIITEFAVHGNLFSFLKRNQEQFDDKVVRTYFRQLIHGIEYLHANDVAHMDLKLDNLLIDENYNLKIADFDMSHYKDDAIIISNGTKHYRAPEVRKGKCHSPKSTDIYSASIILFILKTKGIFPQFNMDNEEESFTELLNTNPGTFWEAHCQKQKLSSDFFDKDFRELFIMMSRPRSQDRAKIEEIKQSKWFNGAYYNAEELKEKLG